MSFLPKSVSPRETEAARPVPVLPSSGLPPPSGAPRTAADEGSDAWWRYAGLAVVALIFTAAGPLAIILSVAGEAALPPARISSWIFATFFFNGIATIVASRWRREPLAFLWTIPGTILVGPALSRYGLDSVIGAYLACAALLLALGSTRALTAIERAIPMPVVMGMIGGVFLKFGLQLVQATVDQPSIAGAMVAAYVAVAIAAARGARVTVPPVLAALAVGLLALPLTGFEWPAMHASPAFAGLRTAAPAWDARCLTELVLPLAVTVVFVQNAQGIAVLRAAGHRPSLRLATLASGALSALCALFGACPSTLAGPSNAILVSAGKPAGHYVGAIALGAMCMIVGLFAPWFAQLMTALPPAFVAALAGLAMLPVIERALHGAFRSTASAGAVVSFLVSASPLQIAGIGAPFWGLLIGAAFGIGLGEHRRG